MGNKGNKTKAKMLEAKASGNLEQLLNSGTLPVRVPQAKIMNACQTLIDNGFNERGAFVTTFPEHDMTNIMARMDVHQFWRRPEVQDQLKTLILGRNGILKEGEMHWAIDTWRNWIELSILDYWGMDGEMLTTRELKALPRWMQTPIKTLEVTTFSDKEGNENKKVKITLIDKERALHDMARAMKWITATVKVEADDHLKMLAESMAEANDRAKRMGYNAIEVDAEVIEHGKED